MNTKMMKFTVLIAAFMSAGCSDDTINKNIGTDIYQSQELRVVPQPQFISYSDDDYRLPEEIVIGYSAISLQNEAVFLQEYLKEDYGLEVKVSEGLDNKPIQLIVDPNFRERVKGAYRINVDNEKIEVIAKEDQGIFYGIQTIRQALIKTDKGFKLPQMLISDYPSSNWRSVMLDEGRYFKGKDVVKNILDEMARLKMNIFHWHLTDDQGWRLEIKKYPKLTEVGSKRDSTQINNGPDWSWVHNEWDGIPHEGYYTQDDIKEIVEYAKERYIDILPEVEILTHTQAAIASYPQLGTTKKPVRVACNLGVMEEVMDISDSFTMQFIKDVLAETTTLFPFGYIHIGGDELMGNNWKNSTGIRNLKNKVGATEDFELQIWFSNEISKYLQTINRKMIGWSDFLGSKDKVSKIAVDVAPGTVAQYWRGDLNDLKFIMKHNVEVIQSHTDFAYYNNWMPNVYEQKCIPDQINDDRQQIIGIGSAAWGEFDSTADILYDHMFPRMGAYAEIGWSNPQRKDYKSFIYRLTPKYDLWKKKGINYGSTDESKE